MKKLKINNLEVSRICYGGSKLVDYSLEDGKRLIDKAKSLGINLFDSHHRYGNSSSIIGTCNDIVKMTKISAYNFENRFDLIEEEILKLNGVNILWVSDLDDVDLYRAGLRIYDELCVGEIKYGLGITTENPQLAFCFMEKRPECNLFMVPLYIGQTEMAKFIKEAQRRGKTVFVIKTLCDKQLLSKYSLQDCVDFVKGVNPDVIVVSSTNENHLEEIVGLYNE